MHPDDPNPEARARGPAPPEPSTSVASGRKALRWVRALLAGCPFFPVSAGLLLLGIHQLSVDPEFLGGDAEEPKLLFNFSALQIYELLLVGAALFLARRKIWYDATLLVVIENLLVLVPLILVTQAVLIDSFLAWSLCLTGGALAAGRLTWLKRGFPDLNLPFPLLISGFVILLANLALPFAYRPMMELDVGDWEEPAQWLWWLALPALQSMAFGWTVTGPAHGPAQTKPWLPLLIFCLWTTGSAVHLWCVGYVSNLAFHLHLAAPLLWMTAWTLRDQWAVLMPNRGMHWRIVWLGLPAVMTLAAVTADNSWLFMTLSGLNLAVYFDLYKAHRERAAWHLMVLSAFAMVAALPEAFGRAWLPDYSRVRLGVIVVGAYLLWHSLRSHRVGLGLLGSLLAALAPGYMMNTPPPHWGFQIGCIYLIVHSLRWSDETDREAGAWRVLACLGWAVHSLVWIQFMHNKAGWTVSCAALGVLAVYGMWRGFTGRWAHWLIAVAATLVGLIKPVVSLSKASESSPKGLLALGASFLLLGLGTVASWLKGRFPPDHTSGYALNSTLGTSRTEGSTLKYSSGLNPNKEATTLDGNDSHLTR